MRSLILSISRSCFVLCRGCYNHFSWNQDLVSQDHLLAFLWRLKSETGLEKITFSWWDPLSRADIINLLAGAHDLWFSNISLDTVGTPLLKSSQTYYRWKEYVEKVDIRRIQKYISYLGIPLDWINNQMTLLFREGRGRLFEETLELLSMLMEFSLKININTVVTKHNYKYLNELYCILGKYPNVARWQLFQYIPTHWNYPKIDNEFYLSDELFENAVWNINKNLYSNLIIQPKSIQQRNNQYLLIDHSWFAWIPDPRDSHKKKIVGNICKIEDFPVIVSQFCSKEIF